MEHILYGIVQTGHFAKEKFAELALLCCLFVFFPFWDTRHTHKKKPQNKKRHHIRTVNFTCEEKYLTCTILKYLIMLNSEWEKKKYISSIIVILTLETVR